MYQDARRQTLVSETTWPPGTAKVSLPRAAADTQLQANELNRMFSWLMHDRYVYRDVVANITLVGLKRRHFSRHYEQSNAFAPY